MRFVCHQATMNPGYLREYLLVLPRDRRSTIPFEGRLEGATGRRSAAIWKMPIAYRLGKSLVPHLGRSPSLLAEVRWKADLFPKPQSARRAARRPDQKRSKCIFLTGTTQD